MGEKKKSSSLWDWIKAIAVALVIAFLIKSFLFQQYIVYGESMMPTIQDGNRLIINKISYDISKPERFDVIVFHATPKEDYIKRIIGLPGDHIAYKNDQLYVNGKKIAEPYLDKYKKEAAPGKLTEDFTLEEVTGQKVVPQGKLFVMGDNRQKSEDSRIIGFVDMKQVVGEVNLRFWPFHEMQVMK
ncbi:signal peptidase I [Fictibacillus sp. Mic-4]|uniref:signal peptidase I n=1 Tax=Fictibacillus TaxID=1329200 RepID=UPI000425557A|nr:signal peptidase I [Fictibacillus gelatini]